MKKVKKDVKKLKIVIIVLVAIIVVMTSFIVYKKFIKEDNSVSSQTKVVDKIEKYGYTLSKNAPQEYKDMFYQLQDVLKSKKVDEEAYAKLVARMVVFDFYNLDNKISKNDIGGTQFILSDYKDNFILEASETVYKYVEHNIYGDRTQQLPIVTKTVAQDLTKASYSYNDVVDDSCYVIKVGVTYKEDLKYPKEVTVKLVHKGEKLEVFYMK